jgi:glutamate-1-semialdehyde 2,1-aminomutase
MKTTNSRKLFRQAQKLIPGGVNSPVRAFRSVGGTPLFIAKAKGATVTDADGNTFLDYVSSWGPMILGHAHPKIVSAIRSAAGRGTSYGAPTAGEVTLARLLRGAFPSIERVRLVSSGTEAAMSAVRLARGFTGRDKIVKFEGCYHGHADPMLVKAGSGALTFGQPDSPGVPADTAKHTLTATFNDPASVRRLFDRNRGQIAAVIVEPIPGNMGVVPPAPGFLDELREITRVTGALLVFDEVITGFRVAFGGAQELFGIQPDLTVLGKIIGGGLPVGAFGGRRDVMAALSPEGPVYQAGTLSGNPLAVAAGIAALTELSKKETYQKIAAKADYLGEGLQGAFRESGVPTWTNRIGSMWTTFFQEGPVVDYATAKKSDTAAYGRYFRGMLARGVYLAPSQFEAGFVSLAHTRRDLDRTIGAARETLREGGTRR